MRTPRWALIALVLGLPSAAAAQSGGAFGAGIAFENYAFGDATATGLESVALVSVPFAAQYRFSPSFSLNLNGAAARGSVSLLNGDTESLSGLTDTSLRLTWMLGGDAVAVSAAALLPTGSAELTSAEAVVAGTIGSDLLPFRVSSWGSGGGVDGSVAFAGTSGSTGFGFRVGYTYSGEFNPVAAPTGGPGFNYDPGDQLYVRGALDKSLESGGKLSASVTVQSFGEDAANGSDFFASGTRIQGLASYVFPWMGRGSAHVYGGFLARSEGQFQLTPDQTTSQTVLLGGIGSQFNRGRTILRPALDIRVLRTGDGLGQGYIASGGVSAIRRSAGLTWTPSAKLRYGSLAVASGVDSSVLGFEVGVSLQFGSTR